MENVAALPPLVEDLESESHRMVHVALGQNRVLEWIAMGRPIQETLDGLLRYLERDTPEMSCSILLLDEQGRHLRHCAAPSLPAA
jgi:GAF domain-containing protein